VTHLRRRLFLTALALAPLAEGCTGAGVSNADASGVDAGCTRPPNITLGTGTANYEALAEGADIELIHGPQGGYHLWVTANFALSTSPSERYIDFVARREDGTMLGSSRIMMSEARLTRTPCGWFRGGDFVVLEALPAEVTNTNVNVTVRILERDLSTVVSDQRRVHIVDLEP
jgi:hypothetical protein